MSLVSKLEEQIAVRTVENLRNVEGIIVNDITYKELIKEFISNVPADLIHRSEATAEIVISKFKGIPIYRSEDVETGKFIVI